MEEEEEAVEADVEAVKVAEEEVLQEEGVHQRVNQVRVNQEEDRRLLVKEEE